MNLDRSADVAAVSNWQNLPWKRVDVLALPGFHTAAENTTGNNVRLGTGSELFMSSLMLMSQGTRTVLLSRWRPGGQSSAELIQNFLPEVSLVGASAAWQRSVQLVSELPLDSANEPRVRLPNNAPELTTSHPFFWAPFMLIDTGTPGVKLLPHQLSPTRW